MSVKSRQFDDEAGKTWTVLRAGSSFSVLPKPPLGVNLCEVGRSCATVVGVTHAPDGTPLAYVNEHIRIWNAIWKQGREIDLNLEEAKSS
jgi:hypothetical protein